MLYCKKNVRFGKIRESHLYLFERLLVISGLMMGKDLWITSANDSKHRNGSKHYEDSAFDIRTRDLKLNQFSLLSINLEKTGLLTLILFEWREKVNGRWVKHKAKYYAGSNTNYFIEFEKYLNCKNEKVSHLHVEW